MKRLTLALSSLALVGVGCGGRVGQNNDGGSGASATPGTGTGGAGKSVGTGGKSTGSGGSSSPGMVGSGKAGASGSGGRGGGFPSGGNFGFGGDSGVGGAVMSFGGAAPDGTEACALYCTAYAKVCRQAGHGAPEKCTQDCLVSLELDNAVCSAGKRDAYACIGNALLQAPGDCNEALIIAKQECGGASPQVRACNANCLPTSISGGGDGCHSTSQCNGSEVDLHCKDTNTGDVTCTCSINGKRIWDIATGFDYSKAGCIDDAMFRLCAKELP